MTVRMRQEIERKIVEAVIDSALKVGYMIAVNDGEEITLQHCKDKSKILAAMFTTDEDRLFIENGKTGEPFGWILFIYGNGGYDVVSDYTTNLEQVMAEAKLISDYYSEDGEYRTFEEWKTNQFLNSVDR